MTGKKTLRLNEKVGIVLAIALYLGGLCLIFVVVWLFIAANKGVSLTDAFFMTIGKIISIAFGT